MKKIAVLPGDGIGKDVTREAVKVLELLNAKYLLDLDLVHFDWDADRYLKTGETVPPGAFEDFRRNYAAILLGAFGDPRVPDMKHAADILLGMRFQLDLFVNYRPVYCLHDDLVPLKNRRKEDIQFVVFRENTEGLYAGMGGIFKKGTPDEIATQEEINTRKGVERIIRYAFEFARRHGRRRVCMADKSNVLRFGGDLWMRVFDEVGAEYPEITKTHLYVDALVMQMIKDPASFEVIVTSNMFGDIVTDLGAVLQGGLGIAASGNINPGGVSMFEPIHGSAPKYAGTGRANPLGAILSVQMMLAELDMPDPAARIGDAVLRSLKEGMTTVDLGGSKRTEEVGDAICRYLGQ